MSDTPPPLPVAGQEPWDVDLNTCLTWIFDRIAELQQVSAVAFAADWQFASNVSAPPANGQMRVDTAKTTLWLHKIDTDGFDRSLGLAAIPAGQHLRVRSANGSKAEWVVSGTPTDSGNYFTFPISVLNGLVNTGSRTQIIALT